MLEVEYEEISEAGWTRRNQAAWLNVYENGKAILCIRIVGGKAEIYQFDQGGE